MSVWSLAPKNLRIGLRKSRQMMLSPIPMMRFSEIVLPRMFCAVA